MSVEADWLSSTAVQLLQVVASDAARENLRLASARVPAPHWQYIGSKMALSTASGIVWLTRSDTVAFELTVVP
jgi:hypothetical protein